MGCATSTPRQHTDPQQLMAEGAPPSAAAAAAPVAKDHTAAQATKQQAAAAPDEPGGADDARLVKERAAARIKVVHDSIQASEQGSPGAALGPPDMLPRLVALDELPDRIVDVEDGLESGLRSAEMRLLPIAAVLRWDHLEVFEAVKAEDCQQLPYKDVTSLMWSLCLVLSWRWSKEKPKDNTPGWSPATREQWEELQALLRQASSSGLQYLWIDWSCMPQYSADTMTEVMRSKVYYVRAAAMAVLPTLSPLPNSGTVLIVLKRALMVLKQKAKQASADPGPNTSVVEATVAAVLASLLAKEMVAGREYFGRAWTLAERMARYGRKERLCQWLSLEAWIGMIVDAMLKSVDGSGDDQDSRIYKKMLGEEASELLDDLLIPLNLAVKSSSMHSKALEGLEDKVALLCVMAAEIWAGADIPEEAPSLEWLCTYLNHEVTSGMYKAFSEEDLLWAVYSYFIWKQPDRTVKGVEAALNALAELCLQDLEDTYSRSGPGGFGEYPWSAATYRSLGLMEAAAAQEELLAGMKAVLNAAEDGKLDALKMCLDAHPTQIDACLKDGETALYKAACRGHKDVLSLLLERGSDTRKATNEGATALHRAARRGDKDCVSLLLKRGADTSKANKDGETALHLAAGSGNKDCVALLLESGFGADIHKTYYGGWTALHRAAGDGRTDVVSLLLAKGSDIHKATNDGETALHLAAGRSFWTSKAPIGYAKGMCGPGLTSRLSGGDKDLVFLLLEHGADIHEATKWGETALHRAAGSGRTDSISLLLERGADIHKADNGGWTALLKAAAAASTWECKGSKDAVSLLLERGSDIHKATNGGDTALHLAAGQHHGSGDKDCVSLLLERGANIHEANNEGETALHRAAGSGDKDCVSLLLERGADIHKANNVGETALHRAATACRGNKDCVALLLKRGADIHQVDNKGETALHKAVACLRSETVALMSLLLERGADIHKANHEGETALHQAAALWSPELVSLLLEHGADIHKATNAGETALMVARKHRNKRVVELLQK